VMATTPADKKLIVHARTSYKFPETEQTRVKR
jgi:hypothetical protein